MSKDIFEEVAFEDLPLEEGPSSITDHLRSVRTHRHPAEQQPGGRCHFFSARLRDDLPDHSQHSEFIELYRLLLEKNYMGQLLKYTDDR